MGIQGEKCSCTMDMTNGSAKLLDGSQSFVLALAFRKQPGKFSAT